MENLPSFEINDLENLPSAQMPVRDPRTGKPTTGRIEIASPDSDRSLEAEQQLEDEKAKREEPENAKQRRKDRIWIAAQITMSWNLTLDGKPMPCTNDAAVRLYSDPKFHFLVAQIENWHAYRKNFMKPLPVISGDTDEGQPLSNSGQKPDEQQAGAA